MTETMTGERIQTLRRQKKLSQAELAKKVGVHESTIRRWERGQDRGPTGKSLKDLVDALETTSDYLLGTADTLPSPAENVNPENINPENVKPENVNPENVTPASPTQPLDTSGHIILSGAGRIVLTCPIHRTIGACS